MADENVGILIGKDKKEKKEENSLEQENQRLRKIILDNAANLTLSGEDKKFLMGVLFR